MRPALRPLAPLAPAALLLLALTGCGASDGGAGTTSAPSTEAAPTASGTAASPSATSSPASAAPATSAAASPAGAWDPAPTEAALRALGNFGRLVVIGFAAGDIPRLPANQVLLRNRTVVGVDWGAWAMANPDDNQALVRAILDDAAAGRLNPQQPAEYALDDVGAAMADLLGRALVGKAVLVP